MSSNLTKRELYERDGFYLAKGLYSPEEAESLRSHYFKIHAEGGHGYCEGGIDPESTDPLRRFPRMMQPHRGDQTSFDFLTDPRLDAHLTEVLGASPIAVQTMVYFKPAGSRGQALHQDNRYLRVEPGTCAAAWLALERCDAANGCLQVVPGSHRLPVLCPTKGDTSVSFTSETVPVPADLTVETIEMDAGDVLFFHGNLIHGSDPNTTTDRFRTIIAAHYVVAEAKTVSQFYFPAYRMDGSLVDDLGHSESNGPCGTFVDANGKVTIEITGTIEAALAAH